MGVRKYGIKEKARNKIFESAQILIDYSIKNKFVLCNKFYEDLENIKLQKNNDINKDIPLRLRNYIKRIYSDRIKKKQAKFDTSYFLKPYNKNLKDSKNIDNFDINFHSENITEYRKRLLEDVLKSETLDIKIFIKKIEDKNLSYEDIDKELFCYLKDGLFKEALYYGRYYDLRAYLIKDVKKKLDQLTKDYKEDGTDEQLTKEEKEKALENSYRLIDKALKKSDIPQSIKDKITLLQNNVLSTTRYKTELLKQLQENNLNQIAINKYNQRYYLNLFNCLVEYFELLYGLEIRLKELKYFDDGFSAKYKIKIDDESMAQWYQFYKNYAKDRYKSSALHSVYCSYLHNIKNITLSCYKKIFKATQLQKEILPIYVLPI